LAIFDGIPEPAVDQILGGEDAIVYNEFELNLFTREKVSYRTVVNQ